MQNKTPENWEEKTLEDVCNVEYGTRVVRKKDAGSTYPVYGGGGATFYMDTYNRENCMVVARFAMSEKCTRFVNGKFFLNDSGLTVSPRDKNVLIPSFLNWQLISLNNFIFSLGRGSAQKNLNIDLFKKINIKYPVNIQEQERIVKILDEVFVDIEKAKQNAAQNLKNTKELFENITEGIFVDIPAEKVKLSSLTSLITKGSSPKWQGFDYCTKTDESILFITSENVGKDLLLLEKLKYLPTKFNNIQSRSILQKGDILTNIVGASIGRTAIFNLEETCNINQAVCLIRLKNPKYIPFIVKFLNTKMAISSMLGMVKDCARANISLTNISDLYIPLPELTKQQEIVNKLDELQEQTSQLEKIYEQEIKDLDELKQSILQKAFRGECSIIDL